MTTACSRAVPSSVPPPSPTETSIAGSGSLPVSTSGSSVPSAATGTPDSPARATGGRSTTVISSPLGKLGEALSDLIVG